MEKSRQECIGFNDLWLRIICIPVLGFLIPLVFFDYKFIGFADYWTKWLEASFFALVYWEGVRLIVIQVRRRYPEFRDAGKRVLLQVVLSLTYVNIAGMFCGFFFFMIKINDFRPTTFQIISTNFTTVLFFLAIYESIFFYFQLRQSIEEKELVKQEHIRSQLEGLRNQVNPHFLFNSLNTLMNIVAEDQDLAIRFLKKLSKVYRYVLDIRDQKLVPLSQELDFIHSYVFLQKERFGDNLKVEIDVPDTWMNHKVIPLSLQLLFENAIKHNVISAKKPLTVRVFIKHHTLVVENNLQRKSQQMPSTQVGLENIRNRYRFFTDQRVQVLESTQHFSVAIPLVQI